MTIRLPSRWAQAIADWRATGSTARIEALIVSGDPVPEEQRQVLADIVAGRVKRTPGRRASDTVGAVAWPVYVRHLYEQRVEVLRRDPARLRGETPTERALADVAEHLGMKADEVDKIVFPRRSQRR